MGTLVAASSLDAGARSAIRVYIRLVRGPLLPFYEEALKSFVASGEEARATPAEERRVLQETGMQLVESLALGMARPCSLFCPRQSWGRSPTVQIQWLGVDSSNK